MNSKSLEHQNSLASPHCGWKVGDGRLVALIRPKANFPLKLTNGSMSDYKVGDGKVGRDPGS